MINFRKAIKKLDTQFSLFIRLRDSDIYGYGNCITCGKRNYWKRMDNGHYMKRQHLQTRFDEQNCNLQCKGCNNFEQGANEKYKVAIDKKYGEGISDKLEMKKLMRGSISTSDVLVLEKLYKNKVKELLSVKELKENE